jgi:predicted transposase YdaD
MLNQTLPTKSHTHRIYLDELGDVRRLPVTVAATVLTIVKEEEAPEVARSLLARTEQEGFTAREKQNIIDIVSSIILYKFSTLSQAEVRAMLGLNFTEEPRAIREAKEEVRGQEAIALITRLLNRRLGQPVSEEMRSRLTALPLPVLEDLSEALLDFSTVADLEAWLANQA